MFLVQNERAKHLASWLNSLAAALVAAGVFAPAAALVYGLSRPGIGAGYVLSILAICLGGGIFLHWLGNLLLGRLRE